MAYDGESVAWNPALRPDDNKDLVATDLDAWEFNTEDSTAEIPSDSPESPIATQKVDSLSNNVLPESEPSIDVQGTVALDVTNPDALPRVDENLTQDTPLEEPQSNGLEWMTEEFDDNQAAPTLEEADPIEQSSDVNAPQSGTETAKVPTLHAPEETPATADEYSAEADDFPAVSFTEEAKAIDQVDGLNAPQIEIENTEFPTAQTTQDPFSIDNENAAGAIDTQSSPIVDGTEAIDQLGDTNAHQHGIDSAEAPAPQPTEDPFSTVNDNAQAFEAHEPVWPKEHDKSTTANGEFSGDGQNFWDQPSNGDAGDGFFDQLKTQTKPIYIPETESRFEEGLPLLSDTAETPVEESAKQKSPINNIFDGDDDEEGAFFSEVQKSEPAAVQPDEAELTEKERPSMHITRKSTSQVLDSLDAAPYSPASETSPTAQEFDNVLAAAASENQIKEVLSDDDDDLAARWQAELSDDQAEQPTEEDLAARWQAELDDDDDDLLLEDEAGDNLTSNQETNFEDFNGVVHNAAPAGLSTQSPANPNTQPAYTPHQPSTSDLLQGFPMQGAASQASTASTGYFATQPQSNPTDSRASSFAERSKEGYKSPYDLPDDLSRPRRPVVSQKPVITPSSSMPPPPSRSTSMPMPPPKTSALLPTPPIGTSPSPTVTAAKVAAPKNFYEELPLPPPMPRSRPTSSGRYTPDVNAPTAPPSQMPPPPPPANPYASLSPALPQTSEAPFQSQLQKPEQLDPYSNLLAPSGPSAPIAPNVPSAASRYSPQPPTLGAGNKPPPSPRYSPAPPQSTAPPPPRNRYASQPSGSPGQGANLPFQPRTSSPLAYHEKISYRPHENLKKQSLSEPVISVAPPTELPSRPREREVASAIPPLDDAVPVPASPERVPVAQQYTSPPRNPYAPPEYTSGISMGPPPLPSVASSLSTSAPPADSQFAPPRRSQTQSPGQQVPGPRLSVPSIDPFQRPASVHGSGSPTKTASPYAPSQVSTHNRVASQQLEFIPPTDGQQFDPLERWKGAPIVKFGFAGSITSCFPKHVPRYTAGQPAPKIKSSPGEVKIYQFSDWVPTMDSIVPHPGPLKNKSKKKDLLAWLSSKVAAFENEGISEAAQLHPDSHKRHDEKILLWKIVKILVEHDGNLEGSTEVQKSLRNVIFPHLQNVEPDQGYGGGPSAFNPLQPLDASSRPDAVDPQFIENVRNSLLVGDREKAVWSAVDNRLWGHAMLIASTLERSVWKQVVQEFVRREVRSTTSNTESLAALYEIFAGNIEESVDELVPPSARAGLQMVSKVNGQGSSKNALDGLDSWRDTLGLVLSNRSPEDHQALLALGRLLQSYGRIEAAQICFIFSRATVFGGADDPQASVVLLGADHQHLPSNALQDDDSILLTEAYEYATSVLAGSPMATLPHLLAFKLVHAWSLAERGRKAEALQYCDAIATSLKASTKPSGYYNQDLYYGVDNLSACLRQTTTDGGSSWISKPSMEKVSGSMWAKFNSFVAGDDSDAASTGSGKAGDGEVGPFAKMAGTPTVSRSPSVSDIYGPYPPSAVQPIPSSAPSRYQPNNQYAPNSSPEQMRGRSSLDSQRSSSYGFSFGQRRGSQEPSTPIDNNLYQGGYPYNSPPAAGYQSTPPQTSYMPLAPVDEDSAAQPYSGFSAPSQGSPMNVTSYQPPGGGSFGPPLEQPPATMSEPDGGSYMPPSSSSFGPPLDQPPVMVSEPEETSYMPPAASGGGYEPPSFDSSASLAPEPSEEAGAEKSIQRKKSFMDDDDEDDDFAARAAAVQKAEKARKDREADEAFRKAAEADAQKPVAGKKSWFGGWFGGGKKEEMPGTGPIRAKLGEANSFYYDKELKKWVNKKDPDTSTGTRGAPPPPKGPAPPSRTASGSSAPPPAMGTPSTSAIDSRPSSSAGGPPSLSSSPAPPMLGVPPLLNPASRSVSTGAAVPTPPGSAMGLPPRPATSLSNASSIDDLLGAPTARKGNAARGKKKGRYVDVMAK